MFTGIVEEFGTVTVAGGGRLTIATTKVIQGLEVGGSINVNGACLTVVSVHQATFSVDVVPETLRRTNLGRLAPGDGVDLERPVAVNGRLDGHIVQGHVDGTGTIESVADEGKALLVRVKAPLDLMRYVVEKGFVAVDGVSLTVVHSLDDGFTVTIIPFTNEHTVFNEREVGDEVNIEVDILAKYVERLTQATERKERD